jgi:hypothetical protein
MRTQRQTVHTWYKYINMFTTVEAVGCSHIWKRFSGEVKKQGLFQLPKPFTHMEAVPFTHMEVAFEFASSVFQSREIV